MNSLFKSFDPVQFYGLDKKYFDSQYDLEYMNTDPLVLSRGGWEYHTPFRGWKRYALNTDHFGSGGKQWIGCDGKSGEWAVAYHGLRRDVLLSIKGIAENGFKVYTGRNSQWGSENEDVGRNSTSFKDKKCGTGVFCTPQLKFLKHEENCEKAQLVKPIPYKEKYYIQTVLQCRVNPRWIRVPRCAEGQYYIINDPDNIRAYGILVNFMEEDAALEILKSDNFNLSPLS